MRNIVSTLRIKMNKQMLSNIVAGVLAGISTTSFAEEIGCNKLGGCDERIVVKGELMRHPLTVTTDPKKPRLPLPSYDGAGFLKTIPGFNINRKGGGGGDPSLRGLGGSRINIVDDGQQTYGCLLIRSHSVSPASNRALAKRYPFT
ncbi:TonB-dependent receptor plug domain-containing protein [Shewanella sp. SNU WT4]|uniref:TonB-dependent receptor plug domain-containing protein n=1 Tax=Shewanella sp. SNU WT4 TaxID=2590015 RepID=UPI001F0F2004|nr:TonB-dependent receptor plug domain-containing protein [Shewanella sp. SNU WT4]